ncbi:MAG TPA: imidazolonepropionase [Geminicoccus sp.]|jgi:imidazolonepropionase|uniref:imidazolonepropionase n=1 Tax=Geminicoccus sp. TaxID=2024832 RepID=UPI002E30D8B0|nr:imidazolonepropionase [Geminicoccus sp.]HEX2529738.1 imidazolonepropionase [Geminicoccus sp.]
MDHFDRIWVNVHLATMTPDATERGEIRDGALAVRDGRIAWIGRRADLPDMPVMEVHDGAGAWLLPGLIDCHTHAVFAGDRCGEFEERLEGVPYVDIARRGGGIRRTVEATRAADLEALVALARPRLARLLAEGVTTVEIKSGYGLETQAELRMLRAARALQRAADMSVVTSFLGAHAFPVDLPRADYVDLVCGPMLDAVAAEGLADAVDGFCEGIAFSPAETERVFQAARAKGLPVKLHADQLSDTGGAALAARFGALSCDHLEYTSEAGVRAMAEAGTVAVVLPGAFYMLREKQLPPIDLFRRHGVPMAVATDANPGSSPMLSPLLAMNMACILFGLTPYEALQGMTVYAARALGLEKDRGTLEVGKRADLTLWRISRPAELCYWLGFGDRLLVERVVAGRPSAATRRGLG